MTTPILQDEHSYTLHMSGFATTIHHDDDERDIVERLHEVVAEVTGRPVEGPEKARMGFLP